MIFLWGQPDGRCGRLLMRSMWGHSDNSRGGQGDWKRSEDDMIPYVSQHNYSAEPGRDIHQKSSENPRQNASLTNWRHLNVWVGPFLNSCWDPFLTNFVAFFWTFFWTFFGCFDSTCRKLDSHEENVSKQYCFNTFFQVMQKIIWKIKKWILKNQNNGPLKTKNRP